MHLIPGTKTTKRIHQCLQLNFDSTWNFVREERDICLYKAFAKSPSINVTLVESEFYQHTTPKKYDNT